MAVAQSRKLTKPPLGLRSILFCIGPANHVRSWPAVLTAALLVQLGRTVTGKTMLLLCPVGLGGSCSQTYNHGKKKNISAARTLKAIQFLPLSSIHLC